MPEKRNLRSSNKDTSSSTEGGKARSGSQSSSSNKDKPVPTRSTSSRSKGAASKKATTKTSANEGSGDKPQTNGTDPIENGVNGADDVEMIDEEAETDEGGPNDTEDKMTVVVPPSKSLKLSEKPKQDEEGDVAMDNAEKVDSDHDEVEVADPRAKAISGEYFPPNLALAMH